MQDAGRLLALVEAPPPDGEPFELELVEQDPLELVVRAVERKSGHAITHRVRRGLFETHDYRQFLRVHHQLVELAGSPPFTVGLGDQTTQALSFEELRRCVLQVAQHGIKLQRFKGLGEMNADQLGETTMDPASRTLQQVTMEDASASDQLFSMLMGDQVEPACVHRDLCEVGYQSRCLGLVSMNERGRCKPAPGGVLADPSRSRTDAYARFAGSAASWPGLVFAAVRASGVSARVVELMASADQLTGATSSRARSRRRCARRFSTTRCR